MTRKSTLNIGSIKICTNLRKVLINNRKIKLRKKEYELLEFLARNSDRVINRLTILEYVWNYHANIETNTLEVHMAGLRKKIAKESPRKMIRTVHGFGYQLCTK